jgi:glycosyltransferase involved in cell wall biosynthesis
MQISLIIPTKDRAEILLQTLEKVRDSIIDLDAEVIIVNDSSTTKVIPLAGIKNLRIIQNSGSGVASARNIGAANAESDLFWFLDDDMWINREMLVHAIELNKRLPDSVFNFNWEYPPYLIDKIRKEPFGRFLENIEFTTMKGWCKDAPWNDLELFPTKWLAGATLLIPKNIYSMVNGYNATFPLAGFEDHDFSVRLHQKDVTCFIEPRYIALHNELNKTNLRGFLIRTFNNAITRRHGVSIGYDDQRLNFPFYKTAIFNLINFIKPVLLRLTDYWPNLKMLDPLYFRFCQLLIGAAIFKGYQKGG